MDMKKLIATALLLTLASVGYAANEITAAITFKAATGYLDFTRAVNAQWTITNASPNIAGDSQSLTTGTVSAVTQGALVKKGWGWFRNLSTNNTMSLGVVDASTNYIEFAQLKAGEYGLIRLGTNTLYATLPSCVTNETTSVLEKAIIDD